MLLLQPRDNDCGGNLACEQMLSHNRVSTLPPYILTVIVSLSQWLSGTVFRALPGCGSAPDWSLKIFFFVVMITEGCRAKHCGNATVLTSIRGNGLGQHSTAQRSRGETQHYMESRIIAVWHTEQHEMPRCSRPHDFRPARLKISSA